MTEPDGEERQMQLAGDHSCGRCFTRSRRANQKQTTSWQQTVSGELVALALFEEHLTKSSGNII